MADYNFDIAFDWNILADTNGQLPLMIGLATFNQPPQLGNQYTFNQGDSFCFNAFNQTTGATQGSYSISSCTVTFRPAVVEPATSPIDTNSLTRGPLSSTGTGPSDVFPGSNYPNFCPVFPLQPIITQGDFLFTVTLVVVPGPDGSVGTANGKTFTVDPEMIVGGTN